MDDERKAAQADTPIPTVEQLGNHLKWSLLGWMVVCVPFSVLLDPLSFLGLQIYLFVGTKIIDNALRRMRSSVVLAVQTFGQSIKLVLLAATWPFIRKSLNDRADEFHKRTEPAAHN